MNTMVQLSTPYIDAECRNAQHHRRTQTERQTQTGRLVLVCLNHDLCMVVFSEYC